MTTFKQLKNGQEFQIPGSGVAMEKNAVFQKRTNSSYVQIFPKDYAWMREIKPRVDIEVLEV